MLNARPTAHYLIDVGVVREPPLQHYRIVLDSQNHIHNGNSLLTRKPVDRGCSPDQRALRNSTLDRLCISDRLYHSIISMTEGFRSVLV